MAQLGIQISEWPAQPMFPYGASEESGEPSGPAARSRDEGGAPSQSLPGSPSAPTSLPIRFRTLTSSLASLPASHQANSLSRYGPTAQVGRVQYGVYLLAPLHREAAAFPFANWRLSNRPDRLLLLLGRGYCPEALDSVCVSALRHPFKEIRPVSVKGRVLLKRLFRLFKVIVN